MKEVLIKKDKIKFYKNWFIEFKKLDLKYFLKTYNFVAYIYIYMYTHTHRTYI